MDGCTLCMPEITCIRHLNKKPGNAGFFISSIEYLFVIVTIRHMHAFTLRGARRQW